MTTWRTFADWAKRNPSALRVADRLGRGRGRRRWLDRLSVPPPAPATPDLANWENLDLAAAWIGHATILLRIGGMTILTDPVFSHRIGIGLGLMTVGPMRKYAAALKIRELPTLDLILLSHSHFDHLDRPSLSRLPNKTPVVMASGMSDLVRDLGYRQITELRWGESVNIGPLSILAHEVRHWGARTFYDTHRGYNSYFINSNRHRILFGGDTAYQEAFRETSRVNLAILGIGAYNPYIAAHATPEQAWQMAGHVDADFVMPMHHSTFRLSHEPMEEPMQRMLVAAGKEADRVVTRDIGGMWKI